MTLKASAATADRALVPAGGVRHPKEAGFAALAAERIEPEPRQDPLRPAPRRTARRIAEASRTPVHRACHDCLPSSGRLVNSSQGRRELLDNVSSDLSCNPMTE